MIVLEPRQYCEITNPVIRDKDGKETYDKYGQVQCFLGEVEYRFHENYNEPFPLYPKEVLSLKP